VEFAFPLGQKRPRLSSGCQLSNRDFLYTGQMAVSLFKVCVMVNLSCGVFKNTAHHIFMPQIKGCLNSFALTTGVSSVLFTLPRECGSRPSTHTLNVNLELSII